MIKKFTVVFSIILSLSLFSQKKTAMERMIDELQQIKQTSKSLKLVWWIPTEFWQVVMKEQKRGTPEQRDYINNLFNDYTILVAGNYSLASNNGTLDFTVNDVQNSLVFYENGQKLPTLKESDIDSVVLSLMNDTMKPVFTQMLGTMGSGIEIFIYNNKNSAGKRILDPYKPGTLTAEMGKDLFEWKLPMVSIMQEKVCKTDSSKFPGNYIYCPFHGTEL